MSEILFVSRGHGFGHAARDLQVIRALQGFDGINVRILAAGNAAAYYRLHGVPCERLDIPDEADMTREAAKVVWRALAAIPAPDLVVTDEVPWVVPYCARFWKRPCVALTCFMFAEHGFPEGDRWYNAAAEVLVLNFPHEVPEQHGTTADVHFVGPVVRRFAGDQAAARERLGIVDESVAGVLNLGGMTRSQGAQSIAHLVTAQWRAAAGPGSLLYVLADPPPDAVEHDADSVLWTGFTKDSDSYYVAADLVITNAMGAVLFDLTWNGVPTVAIVDADSLCAFPNSFHRRVDQLSRTGAVQSVEVDAGPLALRHAVQAGLASGGRHRDVDALDRFRWSSGDQLAARLLTRLE